MHIEKGSARVFQAYALGDLISFGVSNERFVVMRHDAWGRVPMVWLMPEQDYYDFRQGFGEITLIGAASKYAGHHPQSEGVFGVPGSPRLALKTNLPDDPVMHLNVLPNTDQAAAVSSGFLRTGQQVLAHTLEREPKMRQHTIVATAIVRVASGIRPAVGWRDERNRIQMDFELGHYRKPLVVVEKPSAGSGAEHVDAALIYEAALGRRAAVQHARFVRGAHVPIG
jgi:hypothetical protein